MKSERIWDKPLLQSKLSYNVNNLSYKIQLNLKATKKIVKTFSSDFYIFEDNISLQCYYLNNKLNINYYLVLNLNLNLLL